MGWREPLEVILSNLSLKARVSLLKVFPSHILHNLQRRRVPSLSGICHIFAPWSSLSGALPPCDMTYTFNKDQSIMSASRTKFNISRATMCNCCAEMLLLLQETELAYTVKSTLYENIFRKFRVVTQVWSVTVIPSLKLYRHPKSITFHCLFPWIGSKWGQLLRKLKPTVSFPALQILINSFLGKQKRMFS